MKLYKITASWCLSCIYMNEIFDDVLKNKKLNFEIIDYDYDIDSDKINDFNIGSTLPVYILFDNNQEIDRIVGEKSKDDLLTFFDKNGGFVK